MKFFLNKDRIIVEDSQNFNSGSINYYEAEISFDESWDNLNIEAIIKKEKDEEGKSIAVINNKFYIDKEIRGKYLIGFIGYTIENEEKTYQISTNLIDIYFDKGAGEIQTTNSQTLPTPSEWEIYVQELKQTVTSQIDTELENNNVETANNKVTEINSSSTDSEYPSAKCVYDIIGDIESLLGGI